LYIFKVATTDGNFYILKIITKKSMKGFEEIEKAELLFSSKFIE
jgi:hypothetical protein